MKANGADPALCVRVRTVLTGESNPTSELHRLRNLQRSTFPARFAAQEQASDSGTRRSAPEPVLLLEGVPDDLGHSAPLESESGRPGLKITCSYTTLPPSSDAPSLGTQQLGGVCLHG